MDTEKQVFGVYEELKGVLASIPEDHTWFDDDGFAAQANTVIERASNLCPEISNIDTYKILTRYSSNRGPTIDVIPTKSKLNGLIGRIKGSYGFDSLSQLNSGNTFIQNQTQSQQQHQTVILEIQERIINEIQNHEEGTKERNFLEKLKQTLPTLNNTVGIMSSILSIATDSGISVEDIRRLLGL